MQRERWLVTGASGQLGSHVVRQLAADSAVGQIVALSGRGETGTPGVAVRHVDLRDLDALRAAVRDARPTHIMHLGAMTAVADCYADPAGAALANVRATEVLAEAAAQCGARLVFSSTDMVFDGSSPPYREDSPTCPLSTYGRTKVRAEQALAERPQALVVRIPLMYGFALNGRRTTFAQQMEALRAGRPLKLFVDEFRTVVWLADAARALIGLARGEACGLLHIAGPERLSRLELVRRCAALLGLSDAHLEPISRLDAAGPEPRPADLSLDGSRFASCYPALVPGPLRAEALQGPH